MPNVIEPVDKATAERFAIVVAEWNQSVTGKLLEGAVRTFDQQGIADDAVDVAWVPGSWELPVVAQRLARSGKYSAVICLGAVVRGETSHDLHINRGVTLALGEIALKFDLPVLLGVLTCETMEQALDRAGGRMGNKGSECAEAALQMVLLLAQMPAEEKVLGRRP